MNNGKNFKTIAIIVFSVLFVLVITNIFANDKTYDTKPYDFVASKIITNHIVMLGENGTIDHYNLFPYITLINVIESWDNKAKEENLHNKTLTLIMEKSPSAVNLIQNFIDKGDLNPFLDKHGDIYSLEDLYLYHKLRELSQRFKENNNKLKITGFEIDERYDDEWFLKKSHEESVVFFGRG